MKKIFFILFLIFTNNCVWADDDTIYMSLKFNEVNFRAGPSMDFPILFTYRLRYAPVKIVGEYDNWFKVVDKDGDSGWVSEHLLSKFRSFITINDMQILYSSYKDNAYPIYKVEKNVVGKLIKCKEDMCKVKIDGEKGWMNKDDIWGYEEIYGL